MVDPAEVHAVYRVPIEELLDPTHRVTVTHPSGYRSPGFLIGDDKDLILWGFTAGIITRLFDFVGLDAPLGRLRRSASCRTTCCLGRRRPGTRTRPQTDTEERDA